MRNRENPELRLTKILHSEKTKKTAVILILAGIIICIIPLLIPVQRLLFSFVDTRISDILSLLFTAIIILTFAFCCLYAKNISLFLENTANSRLICLFAGGVLALALGLMGIFSYHDGRQWIDSDQSKEMVLGKLLAAENALVSRNWTYSTEIRLVYQTIFIMPLFKLLGSYENWALIRALNIALNNLVLILSYIFMLTQMKIQTKWILISSFFLLMPLSIEYWDIVIFGGNYIFFIAQMFCSLGLFARLSGKEKTAIPDFVLFSILSFIMGVQGIRALIVVYFPLLIASVYLWLKMKEKKHFPLFLGCYTFIICCAGYLGNNLLHIWYSFYSYGNMGTENIFTNFFPKLSRSLANLAGFFGFSSNIPLFSAQGFFSIASIFAALVLFWAVFKAIRQEQLKNEGLFLPVFFVSSVILNFFTFIIVNQAVTSRFFIPFMVLYIPLCAILFEEGEKIYEYLKRTAIIFGITLFIIGQGYTNFQGLPGRDLNSIRKGYIQYLLDNELEFGFATFWNANVTSELSNGRIEATGLDPRIRAGADGNLFSFSSYGNPVKFFDPLYHSKKSFLLLARNEWDFVRSRRSFAGLTPDYEDSHFVIITYPSAEIIHHELLGM